MMDAEPKRHFAGGEASFGGVGGQGHRFHPV
jgi:hypothetical protein